MVGDGVEIGVAADVGEELQSMRALEKERKLPSELALFPPARLRETVALEKKRRMIAKKLFAPALAKTRYY